MPCVGPSLLGHPVEGMAYDIGSAGGYKQHMRKLIALIAALFATALLAPGAALADEPDATALHKPL